MRTALRLVAAILLVGTVIWWLAAGANRGWTKDKIPVKVTEPITGNEWTRYDEGFVPGVDLLALACVSSAAIVGLSFLFGRKRART